MCRQAFNLYENFALNNLVYDSILETETRRSIPLPFAAKLLVTKALDEPQAFWTRDSYDVLPFLVALEDFLGQ